MAVAAVILAAGASERMGRPKALLPWTGGETLVEYQVAQLLAAGVEVVVVVVGDDADRIIPLVSRDGVEPIVNERWREGRAGSVRVGTAAVPRDTDTALIVNVDQPRPAAVYRALLDAHIAGAAQVTRPVHAGAHGHPIVLGRGALAEARNVVDATQGLRAVIDRHRATLLEVPFDDPVVLLDINTPEDYARAKVTFGQYTS